MLNLNHILKKTQLQAFVFLSYRWCYKNIDLIIEEKKGRKKMSCVRIIFPNILVKLITNIGLGKKVVNCVTYLLAKQKNSSHVNLKHHSINFFLYNFDVEI